MQAQLTPHHHRLMKLRLDGRNNPQIAKLLHVSLGTVEYHFGRIHKELQTEGVWDLIPKYYKYRELKNLPPVS